MLKAILDVITPIQETTGLEIDIFTPKGERLVSTHNQKGLFKFDMSIETLKKNEGIVLDKAKNITYFFIELLEKEYIGVITGANEVSKNYAYMVAKLLESAIKREENNLNKQDFFKELLLNRLDASKILSYKEKYNLIDQSFYIINILTQAKDIKDIMEFLQELLQEPDVIIPIQGGNIAVLKTCGVEEDYQSAGEFAQMIIDNIEQELSKTVSIGVGGIAKDYLSVAQMYSQSLSAVRLGTLIEEKSRVYSYKDYLFIKLLEDLSKDKVNQYLNMSLDKTAQEVFKDRELLDTAEQFLNNSLNISETARIMYMHRNTLIYRLDKIENMTGLNLRKFSDAMVFRTLNILYKLSKGESK
mgnify:CR=1 FL=1